MTGRHLHSVTQIARMMDAQAELVARYLFPAGRCEGAEWVIGDLAGNPGKSLKIHIGNDDKRGVWKDFSSAKPGADMLDLVMHARCGGNKVEAIKWCRAWLGIDGVKREVVEQMKSAVELQRLAPKRDKRAGEMRGRAYALWQAAERKILDTPVDRYLCGRAIDLRQLVEPVQNLLYVAELPARNPDPQDGGKTVDAGRWPAMVAPIFAPAGKFMALHRTWLQVEEDGRVIKCQALEDSKKVLGPYKGGIIPIWRGIVEDPDTGELKAGKPLRDAGDGVELDITEGIEDGLSVALEIPEARVWVGVALSSMANIILPANVAVVNLWQQNDPANSQAARAFETMVHNFQMQGKTVKLATAPEGFKDVNDWRQAKARNLAVSA
jgi:hypothetical protein